MTYPLGPAAVPDLAGVVRSTTPDAAVLRIGRVTAFAAGAITVAISDSDVLVNASYLFGAFQPILGDNVLVLKQGSQWAVAGPLSANPEDNVVRNYSFEDDETGDPPSNWDIYHDPVSTDTATITVTDAPGGGELDGPQALRIRLDSTVTGQQFSIDLLSSAPFPVQPGEKWTASAWLTGSSQSGGPYVAGSAGVSLAWYANNTDTYPNFMGGGDLVSARTPTALPWLSLRAAGASGGVEVPAGAAFGRVTLYTNLVHTELAGLNYAYDVYWDRVIARKLP